MVTMALQYWILFYGFDDLGVIRKIMLHMQNKKYDVFNYGSPIHKYEWGIFSFVLGTISQCFNTALSS